MQYHPNYSPQHDLVIGQVEKIRELIIAYDTEKSFRERWNQPFVPSDAFELIISISEVVSCLK